MTDWQEEAVAEIRDSFFVAGQLTEKIGTLAAELTAGGPEGTTADSVALFRARWAAFGECLEGCLDTLKTFEDRLREEEGLR